MNFNNAYIFTMAMFTLIRMKLIYYSDKMSVMIYKEQNRTTQTVFCVKCFYEVVSFYKGGTI